MNQAPTKDEQNSDINTKGGLINQAPAEYEQNPYI